MRKDGSVADCSHVAEDSNNQDLGITWFLLGNLDKMNTHVLFQFLDYKLREDVLDDVMRE